MLITCPECNKEVSDKATACPHCGAPVATTAQPVSVTASQERPVPVTVVKPKSNTIWWVLGTPVVLFFVMMLYGLTIPEYESRARDAMHVCRDLARASMRSDDFCTDEFNRAVAEGKANHSK